MTEKRDLRFEAAVLLVDRFGPGCATRTAIAPGRITLVGEHVDYVGGQIACMAINLHVAVALRPSADGTWRVASGDRTVERDAPTMNRDIGDRVFAACRAAAEVTEDRRAVEIAVAADLPEGAGLSSSAAIVCATLVAQLQRSGAHVAPERLIRLATHAERDIAGIPCGDMDQWAVVASRASEVLIFDAQLGAASFVPWPWRDLILIVVDTGAPHDVGGGEYGERRKEAETVLQLLGVRSCQEIGDRWQEIEAEPLRRRARHLATETRRTGQAVEALKSEDAVALGALITASGRSLDQDYEVTTQESRAVVRKTLEDPGCLGARLVGGGFGGSVMALCRMEAAPAIRRAMVAAVGRVGMDGSWAVEPGEGMASSYNKIARAVARV